LPDFFHIWGITTLQSLVSDSKGLIQFEDKKIDHRGVTKIKRIVLNIDLLGRECRLKNERLQTEMSGFLTSVSQISVRVFGLTSQDQFTTPNQNGRYGWFRDGFIKIELKEPALDSLIDLTVLLEITQSEVNQFKQSFCL